MLRALLPVVGTAGPDPRLESPLGGSRTAWRDRSSYRAGTPVTDRGSPLEALEIAWRTSPRIIVAGSIFLLGDVMKLPGQLVIPFENGH